MDGYIVKKTSLLGEINRGSISGTVNHDELEHRELGNQHPISAITGLTEQLESKSQLVKVTAVGQITAVGKHVYLLDESNSAELDQACGVIKNETEEYIVFVNHGGTYYYAEVSKLGNNLYISYRYIDIADGTDKTRLITYKDNAPQHISITEKGNYATTSTWDDEDFYATKPPTVQAVEERLEAFVGVTKQYSVSSSSWRRITPRDGRIYSATITDSSMLDKTFVSAKLLTTGGEYKFKLQSATQTSAGVTLVIDSSLNPGNVQLEVLYRE